MATKTSGSHQANTTVVVGATVFTRLDRRLAWARETLGLPVGASPAEARAKLLSGLEGEEFVPGEAWLQAYRVLVSDFDGVVDVADPPEFVRYEEEQLSQRTEQFASRMFTLPPEERQRTYQELLQLAQPDSKGRGRLESLAVGVAVELPRSETLSPSFSRLKGYLLELFTLRSTERAMRRAEIVEELDSEMEQWETAARSFRSRYPKLAALDAPLMDTLIDWKSVEREASRPRLDRPVVVRTNGNSGRMGWLALVLVGLIVGAIVRGLGTSPRGTQYYQPNISVPSYEFRPEEFTLPPGQDLRTRPFDDLLKRGSVPPLEVPEEPRPEAGP